MIRGLLPTMLVGALGGLLAETLRILPAFREGKGPTGREYAVSLIYVAVGAGAALYGWGSERPAIEIAVLGAAFPSLFAAGVGAAVPPAPQGDDQLTESLRSEVRQLNEKLAGQGRLIDQLNETLAGHRLLLQAVEEQVREPDGERDPHQPDAAPWPPPAQRPPPAQPQQRQAGGDYHRERKERADPIGPVSVGGDNREKPSEVAAKAGRGAGPIIGPVSVGGQPSAGPRTLPKRRRSPLDYAAGHF